MNGPVEAIKSEKRMLLINYLNENKSRYETLFTFNQDGIFTMDIEGHLVQGNPAFEKISGYAEEEATQLKLQFLFPIDQVNKVFHHFHQAVLGQFQNFDCKMANKIGGLVDLNITNIPICVNDQIVGVCAVARDITELKRKKEEVRKIEEMQRVLTDNLLDLIISTNLQGEIIYVSPSCEYILGYSSDEVIKQNFLSFVHPDDAERTFIIRKEALSHHEDRRDCYRIRKKNGTFIWMESLCKPIIASDTLHVLEVVSVFRDISERTRVEEEAKKREETYRDIVEYSPDAVIIARENEILFINETGTRVFGAATKQDLLTKELSELIHLDYHEIAKKRIRLVTNGEATEFYEYKLIRLDGTTFFAEVKGIPTIFQNKPARHIIIRDITERKKTQELLLNSEKLSVAGQLAAGIAHEVRNPLTAIKGFLQLMEAQAESDKPYFEIIQSEMDRIELILSELLVLAKPQELKIETVDLVSLIDSVKTLLDTQANMNGVHIERLYNAKNFTIKCDKNQLKQVFINILKNAIEAMPKGGIVTIELKKHSFNKVKLLIKDTGNGMPVHILRRLGEPFFTTKEEGTGLGIMISKQIVENHDGTIHFWSDQKGTMIEVILPTAQYVEV
ncbi:sporulation kinase [Neobacillus bataviensis LMG 21833]|uniref:histidine kinase n=1 Tax=Neobacillus bataviensis LMG 21833 TaxID=1117379 RepID=K6DAC7_9BACI|nr:PAS domain-containing sensor histidine kinase [Neobacillus bataviensis]EKN65023.1 sporulation kinase [Neobacillus bataviensis LMG 21833]